MYCEAGRECRYSGKRGYRWHKGVMGVPRGCWGPLGSVRDVFGGLVGV